MKVDPEHWLYKHTPREWIRAALSELERAKGALDARDRKAALAVCRRAAGMAINGMLALEVRSIDVYGQSFMDHIVALSNDVEAPRVVRESAKLLAEMPMPGADVVLLRTANTDSKMLDAARDVMAHAYAMVIKHEPEVPDPSQG
ncbi:MAG: hypothetical protein U0269_03950 [Polyangiales bacterium]